MDQVIGAGMALGCSMERKGQAGIDLAMTSVYRFECLDADGNVKWVEEVENLVVNAGLNDLLDKYFKGSAYSAAFYVGLKGTGTIAAADTLASHSGWTEISAYTGNRKALTLGTVASQAVNNVASPASFAINGSATVAGGFVCTAASGTTGVLYGAANFASNRAVESGDTLNVSVTLSAAAA